MFGGLFVPSFPSRVSSSFRNTHILVSCLLALLCSVPSFLRNAVQVGSIPEFLSSVTCLILSLPVDLMGLLL